MCESYLKDKKKILPCAAMLNGEYSVKGMYLGVPVLIGSKGVEKILEVSLNNSERSMFINSAKSVYNLAKACKNIDKSLSNSISRTFPTRRAASPQSTSTRSQISLRRSWGNSPQLGIPLPSNDSALSLRTWSNWPKPPQNWT